MGYVVLQPHSLTNHSDKYVVVELQNWITHCDSQCTTALKVESEWPTYGQAEFRRDELNKG
jgi:hypothetical protein